MNCKKCKKYLQKSEVKKSKKNKHGGTYGSGGPVLDIGAADTHSVHPQEHLKKSNPLFESLHNIYLTNSRVSTHDSVNI